MKQSTKNLVIDGALFAVGIGLFSSHSVYTVIPAVVYLYRFTTLRLKHSDLIKSKARFQMDIYLNMKKLLALPDVLLALGLNSLNEQERQIKVDEMLKVYGKEGIALEVKVIGDMIIIDNHPSLLRSLATVVPLPDTAPFISHRLRIILINGMLKIQAGPFTSTNSPEVISTGYDPKYLQWKSILEIPIAHFYPDSLPPSVANYSLFGTKSFVASGIVGKNNPDVKKIRDEARLQSELFFNFDGWNDGGAWKQLRKQGTAILDGQGIKFDSESSTFRWDFGSMWIKELSDETTDSWWADYTM